jgi:hypothetical protein
MKVDLSGIIADEAATWALRASSNRTSRLPTI